MCKISFVILHYNNLKDTKKCVNSLKKYLDKFDIEIILVDNGSTKETLKLDAQKLYLQILSFYLGQNVFFLLKNYKKHSFLH